MNKKWTIIFILLILALAIFWRFWQLNQIPPGLYPDVAVNGTNALEALKTEQFKIFYPDNNGREGLFINLIAFSFWLFGPSVWAIKAVAAIFGVLTVLGLYFFTKNLFHYLDYEKRHFIALLTAFLLTINFWHVNFSRIGFRAIMVPFFLVWSFYFLFKAIRTTRIYELYPNDQNRPEQASSEDRRAPAEGGASRAVVGGQERGACPGRIATIIYFALAGLFFGLGFYTYISYRVAPLILLPIIFFAIIAYWPKFRHWLKNRQELGGFFKNVYFKDGWWHWDIFFLAIILAGLPIGLYFLKHPQDFIGRAGQVSVFSSASPLKTLAVSAAKTLGMFNVRGDYNWRHNLSGQPELLWPVGLLFLLGFFYSFYEVFKASNYKNKNWPLLTVFWTLLFWFFVMLLPSILSNEGLPHALRSIGVLPAIFIFSGLGLFLIFNLLKNKFAKSGSRSWFLIVLLFVFLGALAWTEFNKYFFDWGQREEVKSEFNQTLVDEGNYLNSLPDNVLKYVMVNQGGVPVPYPNGIPMPAQTIMFITQGKKNIIYLVPSQNAVALLTTGPAVFVPLQDDEKIFAQLKGKFPNGKTEQIQNEFSVFKINY